MNTPAPSPLGCAISEACVLSWLPDRPNRIKVQLPLGITNLITNFLLAAFPSLTHFPPSPVGASWGHFSNKLLAFKSLSAGLLLTNLDHWALRWSFPHRTYHQPLTCVFHSTPPPHSSGSQPHGHRPLSHSHCPCLYTNTQESHSLGFNGLKNHSSTI